MAVGDILEAPGDLIFAESGGSFDSGGTSLGEKLSGLVLGLDRQIEILTRQSHAGFFHSARKLADNGVLSVVLAERMSTVLDLLWPGERSTTAIKPSLGSKAYGNLLTGIRPTDANGDFHRLFIRPADADAAYLYIPQGYVIAVEAVVWQQRVTQLEATELAIACFYNDVAGGPWVWGELADLPSLP